jgi:CheY-like chemotaxis protein
VKAFTGSIITRIANKSLQMDLRPRPVFSRRATFVERSSLFPSSVLGSQTTELQRYSQEMRVLTEDHKPFQYIDEQGKAAGFGIELVTMIFNEAGVKAMEFKPGLVILDLIMPGMDGFEVCRRIKENSGTSHIKILAITGYDTDENRERIIEAGADGYLAKPLERGILLQQIEGLLNRRGNMSKVE